MNGGTCHGKSLYNDKLLLVPTAQCRCARGWSGFTCDWKAGEQYIVILETWLTAPRLWDDIPDSLRLIDSLEFFKSNLKTTLFKSAFVNYL